ncbi:MAG TPA: hypothetical protein VNL69_11285 [Bacteroidota bacterium]|nr:hypothetical protein [Bacteroidota bacterium]
MAFPASDATRRRFGGSGCFGLRPPAADFGVAHTTGNTAPAGHPPHP